MKTKTSKVKPTKGYAITIDGEIGRIDTRHAPELPLAIFKTKEEVDKANSSEHNSYLTEVIEVLITPLKKK